jgi:hypothetical protein
MFLPYTRPLAVAADDCPTTIFRLNGKPTGKVYTYWHYTVPFKGSAVSFEARTEITFRGNGALVGTVHTR